MAHYDCQHIQNLVRRKIMHNRTLPVTSLFLAGLFIITLFAVLSNATGLISFDPISTDLAAPADTAGVMRSNISSEPLYTEFYQVTGSWSRDETETQRSVISNKPFYTNFDQITGSWRE
jgi:hypothetical protein